MKHTTAQQQEIGCVFTLDGGRATSGHTIQTTKAAPAQPSEQGAPLPWGDESKVSTQNLAAAAPDLYNALKRIVRDLEYTWGGENQMPPAERAYYAPAKAALLKAQGGATV